MIDFSIVTAVYNTAEFIDEAVQSIIDQTVGIGCVQLILVNDASTDNSLDVCRKWERLYPNKIIVVNQDHNQGVSAARNAGKKLAIGKYVCFMDSDDKLAPDVCEKVANFYEQHINEEVDVVALPIIFFDGASGSHPLNDKFERGTRVIDLDKEWYYAQNFISSTFVKADILKDFCFDTKMPLSEDLKFVQEIILRTHRLGVIQNTKYYYRRRSSGTQSAIQSKDCRKVWYIPTLQNGLLYLSNLAKNKEGIVPRYLQYLMMYELQWRLKQKDVECSEMSSSECIDYYKLIQTLLKDIDDEVIMCQHFISADTKVFAKLMKKGWPVDLLKWCRKTKLLKVLKILGK